MGNLQNTWSKHLAVGICIWAISFLNSFGQDTQLQYCGYYKAIPFYNTTFMDAAYFQQCPSWEFIPRPKPEVIASKDPLLRHIGIITFCDSKCSVGTGTVIECPNMVLTAAHVVTNEEGNYNRFFDSINFKLPGKDNKIIRKGVYWGKNQGYAQQVETIGEFQKSIPLDVAILIAYESLLDDGSYLKVYNSAEDSLEALTSERSKFYAGYPDLKTLLNDETIGDASELFVSPIVNTPFILNERNHSYAYQELSWSKFWNDDQNKMLYINAGASGSALLVQEMYSDEWKVAGIFVIGESMLLNILNIPTIQCADGCHLSSVCNEEDQKILKEAHIPEPLLHVICSADAKLNEIDAPDLSEESNIEDFQMILNDEDKAHVYILGREFYEQLLPLAKEIANKTLGNYKAWEPLRFYEPKNIQN